MIAPAVVTGLGLVAPTGVGVADCWAATLDGKSGIGEIGRFDASGYTTTLAGEIPSDEPSERVASRLRAQTDRMTHFALTATELAFADAGIDPDTVPEYAKTVVIANSSGGAEYGQGELEKLRRLGPMHVGAYMSVAWFYAASTGQVSIRHRMRGPCGMVASEQVGALDAVGHARRQLRRGSLLAVTGGTDASLSPAGLVAQMTTRLLSTSARPTEAYLPFDRRAAGYLPGEGGAILVTEPAPAARARGVTRPYGEIAGYAATFDPPPGVDRQPTLRRAIEQALADARIAPTDVDVVFADGYGVPELDRREAAALGAVFGPRRVPVTVPKTMTGRMYAGGSALDIALALLAIRDQVIPPTINVTEAVPDLPFDLVVGARPAAVRCALIVSRGYTGLAHGYPTFNGAMVVRAVD